MNTDLPKFIQRAIQWMCTFNFEVAHTPEQRVALRKPSKQLFDGLDRYCQEQDLPQDPMRLMIWRMFTDVGFAMAQKKVACSECTSLAVVSLLDQADQEARHYHINILAATYGKKETHVFLVVCPGGVRISTKTTLTELSRIEGAWVVDFFNQARPCCRIQEIKVYMSETLGNDFSIETKEFTSLERVVCFENLLQRQQSLRSVIDGVIRRGSLLLFNPHNALLQFSQRTYAQMLADDRACRCAGLGKMLARVGLFALATTATAAAAFYLPALMS